MEPLESAQLPVDNSSWHGLEVGLEKPTWGMHFEWLMPQQGIHGSMADFDWQFPDAGFTDLGFTQERWTEGQMLDLGLEFQLTKRFFTLPIEVWPSGGFRWQRFDIMCYDLTQVKYDNIWLDPPYTQSGNIISFNQQYYVAYIGGQLRAKLETGATQPIAVTFQGDWGYVDAYNMDHHIAIGERVHNGGHARGLVAHRFDCRKCLSAHVSAWAFKSTTWRFAPRERIAWSTRRHTPTKPGTTASRSLPIRQRSRPSFACESRQNRGKGTATATRPTPLAGGLRPRPLAPFGGLI